MLIFVSTAFWLVLGVVGIAVYALSLVFGRSDSQEASQSLGLISDSRLSDGDIDKAMWEAGKHDITKQVDVSFISKLKAREVRTPKQIQEEERVDEGTALAMSSEEFDDLIKPIGRDRFGGFSTVNPATGLLMIGGIGGFDMAGNAYGFDEHDDSMNDLISDDSWHRSSLDD